MTRAAVALTEKHLTKAGERLWKTGRYTEERARGYAADCNLTAEQTEWVLNGRRNAEFANR